MICYAKRRGEGIVCNLPLVCAEGLVSKSGAPGAFGVTFVVTGSVLKSIGTWGVAAGSGFSTSGCSVVPAPLSSISGCIVKDGVAVASVTSSIAFVAVGLTVSFSGTTKICGAYEANCYIS